MLPAGSWKVTVAFTLSVNTLCANIDTRTSTLTLYVCDLQLQAYFLVLDDIMDNSVTRRGRPCWYLHKNLGTAAVNDGLLLEHGLYQLLNRYCRDKPYYINILELFHDVSFIFILKYRIK
jgi:farnesyl diphosphate synthase